jgi:predicted tellurium resistance membrane protein TerC
MYQKVLLAILILLAALRVIAGILNSPRLAKLCLILVVLLIATSLILWVMMGWSPIPAWLTNTARWIINSVFAQVSRLGH